MNSNCLSPLPTPLYTRINMVFSVPYIYAISEDTNFPSQVVYDPCILSVSLEAHVPITGILIVLYLNLALLMLGEDNRKSYTRWCQNGASLGKDWCCAINRSVIDYFKWAIKETLFFFLMILKIDYFIPINQFFHFLWHCRFHFSSTQFRSQTKNYAVTLTWSTIQKLNKKLCSNASTHGAQFEVKLVMLCKFHINVPT